ELRATGRAGRGGRSGVLVKAPKPGQEERVDMPTIGPDTVNEAAAAGLDGIAVAGQVLMAERDATIAAADRHGLFLVGVNLNERSV
ncbi:MAG: UDP-2,3-diacylglucosamine diphosphatase LpxI domain-containing protein, partial [Stellaceae bacterium]